MNGRTAPRRRSARCGRRSAAPTSPRRWSRSASSTTSPFSSSSGDSGSNWNATSRTWLRHRPDDDAEDDCGRTLGETASVADTARKWRASCEVSGQNFRHCARTGRRIPTWTTRQDSPTSATRAAPSTPTGGDTSPAAAGVRSTGAPSAVTAIVPGPTGRTRGDPGGVVPAATPWDSGSERVATAAGGRAHRSIQIPSVRRERPASHCPVNDIQSTRRGREGATTLIRDHGRL